MSSARKKILTEWKGIAEVALIKQVVTKGEHIDLCVEYWAGKRKLPKSEYEIYFHDIVENYVKHLLDEGLVDKAENVLRNVNMHVKCFYYQYATECQDDNIRKQIFELMVTCPSEGIGNNLQEYQLHMELLKELKNCPAIMNEWKQKLHPVRLETLMRCDSACLERLKVELYFTNNNPALLPQVDKYIGWKYLLEKRWVDNILLWVCLNVAPSYQNTKLICLDLAAKYQQWDLESEMCSTALNLMKNPAEIICNCFAKMGYFFPKERNEVPIVLRRACTTESSKIQVILEELPIAQFLIETKYSYLLQSLIPVRTLNALTANDILHNELLSYVAILKSHKLSTDLSTSSYRMEEIACSTWQYLNKQDTYCNDHQPLVVLYKNLHNKSYSSCFNCVGWVLKPISKLVLDESNNTVQFPTPYAMLNAFKSMVLRNAVKEADETVLLSSQYLRQTTSQKQQLTFIHYLKEHRSSYAVYSLLTDHLQQYGHITESQLFGVCEAITELLLQNVWNEDLVVQCIGFMEVLGFDTQCIRNFVKLSRFVGASSVLCYDDLSATVDDILLQHIEQGNTRFPLQHYQAVKQVMCSQNKRWPKAIISRYTKDNDWWHLLIICQYFNVPARLVRHLSQFFQNKIMEQHFTRALLYDNESSSAKRPPYFSRHQKHSRNAYSSMEAATSSTNLNGDPNSSETKPFDDPICIHRTHSKPHKSDLFAATLLSSSTVAEESVPSALKFMDIIRNIPCQNYCTSCNLLQNCGKFQMSVLALTSASLNDLNIDCNWLIYLAVATNQWNIVLSAGDKSLSELAWQLIKNSVRRNCVTTLVKSFDIFYKHTPFLYLLRFLYKTQRFHDFSDDAINELRLFLLCWSNNEVTIPPVHLQRDQVMVCCVKLLLVHLNSNFHSTWEQQKFLTSLLASDMTEISDTLDFALLNQVFTIVQSVSNTNQRFTINFENVLDNSKEEYDTLLNAFLNAKLYDTAIALATLLQMPSANIVYLKWVSSIESSSVSELNFEDYQNEILAKSLPPELLVNFLLYASSQLQNTPQQKYRLLKAALDVIKRNHLFSNECFNRDQIEYEMVICYLQIVDIAELELLDIYHSEYYEEIMQKERCVLYKSFLELKELALIDELNICTKAELTEPMLQKLEDLINKLLDKGDIVEALRLQELFQCRPVNLRFLVFCMALAEGVATIFNLNVEERQLLLDSKKSSFSRFNKRTLSNTRTGHSSQGQHSSNHLQTIEFSDSSSTLEFEEIPPKEKRETLETIQALASKVEHGIDIGKRIVLAYRIAMYLDKEYLDVLRTKDVSILLKSVSEEDCLNRLVVVSDILVSTHKSDEEIAEFLSFEITTAVIRPRFYIFTPDQQINITMENSNLWGHNLDRELHIFFELVPNTTILGNRLLDYCDALKLYRKFQDSKQFDRNTVFSKLVEIITLYGFPRLSVPNVLSAPTAVSPIRQLQVLSHKKQNVIYVELLIKAHQCFVHECSMEGIANVLNRAKSLNSALTKAKSWLLIVRMLTGIGRYREMFYCFDSLIQNDQFESLLGQFDEHKTIGLRQAILSYLREYCQENSDEYLKLAALHFLLYKDLAEIWQRDARNLIERVFEMSQTAQMTAQTSDENTIVSASKASICKLRITPKLTFDLHKVLENYTHATENYLLDNKLMMAQKCASMAELIAVQIDLLNKNPEKGQTASECVCVLNVKNHDELRDLVNGELSVSQSLIISRAYSYEINWSEALFSQYIVRNQKTYLEEYQKQFILTDSAIENVFKSFQIYSRRVRPTQQMEENLAYLVGLMKSITLKYKLASMLGFKKTIVELISNEGLFYLKDTNYSRAENHNISEI